MKKELTDRQQDILNFIQDFVEFNGFPPTYREIGKKFDISSTFGVKRHLDALVKKGHLTSGSNSSRALSIIKNESAQTSSSKIDNFIEIPVVGRVAAGYPILAEENIEGSFVVDQSMLSRSNDCFGLKVRGDSMIKAGIFEGDLVIVSPQPNANNGDIVVALLGDEATMKRFMKKDDSVYLIPENDNYSEIVINNKEDFSIIGKVVGVFRSYN